MKIEDCAKQQAIEKMYRDIQKKYSTVPDFALTDLEAHLKDPREDLVLLDVRTPAERSVSRLPQSIDPVEFEKNFEKYKDRRVVVYCTIGERSGSYAKELMQKGVKAFNLEQSILGWAHRGALVNDKGEKVERLHVYGRKWNLAPSTVKTEW